MKGDEVCGYTVVDKVQVDKLDMAAYNLVHKASGARHVHAARKDSNNNKVFAVGFRTDPPDHSGLPHILEHTALCGSSRYPVRDPFFKMLTRSLANYMNALTGVDYTFYPFATTNESDYYNLQSVYLDAVFNPLLRLADFRQEGWRLEFDDPNNPNSELVYKGVVFNEMKGQMSNPAYLFYIRFFQTIYPSLQFAGGDPAHIVDLKHEDLVAFHAKMYHPSNCFSFSYGSMDLEEVLQPVRQSVEKVLSARGESKTSHSTPQPIELSKNMEVEIKGPEDPTFDVEKQFKVSLSWLAGDSSNLEETIAWKVLGTLLTEGHASPFYKALIDTGIASDFSVNTGLEDTHAKNIFTIGVQGMSKSNLEDFKQAVYQVLQDVAENGIEPARVEAILNQAELADREVDASFGMDLVSRLFPRVFNASSNASNSYMNLLDNEALLAQFRAHLSREPTLFQRLVKERLIGQPHLQFSMVPSKSFEADLASAEAASLKVKVDRLSENDRMEIFDLGLELQEMQQAQEDVSVLPTLLGSDIKKEVIDYKVSRNNDVYTRETATQGISYVSMLCSIAHLDPDLRLYLPLFTSATTNVGTSKYTMSELEELTKLNTGGVSVSLMARGHDNKPDDVRLDLAMGGSALEEKVSHVYSLLSEMISNADYSNISKLRPIISATAQNALNAISDGGHRYAMMHSKASVSGKARLDESLGGLEQTRFIISLSKLSDSELASQVVPKLETIRTAILNSESTISAGLTSTHTGLSTSVEEFNNFANKLRPTTSPSNSTLTIEPNTQYKSHFLLPFQVSYVGASFASGEPYMSKESAALQLLANILTHRYLHKEIREKGGAYGGGATYSALDGIFSFYSYRDPSPLNTIQTMANARAWAQSYDWTKRDLEEAKLSVFQGIDAPISPRSEITYEFLHDLTAEKRQARRDALLSVTLDDVKNVALKHLAKVESSQLGETGSSSLTVLGPPHPEFCPENGWLQVDPEGDL